mmetsp:Transcript_11536/g.31426  ORF Transcript_11536/g.31426 Transcript_11536/m.31426 type:complete len:258 (-) Transcript_11536:138-911(-)
MSVQESFQTSSPKSTCPAARQRPAPPSGASCSQMATSWPEADASVSHTPSQGFHATSRAGFCLMSAASNGSGSHLLLAASQAHTRTPSAPAEARRAPARPMSVSSTHRGVAHETAHAWPLCAFHGCDAHRCSTVSSSVSKAPACDTTVTVPSSEAQAMTAPRSPGAQATARSAPCLRKSSECTVSHSPGLKRRPQTRSKPSSPAEARSTPCMGEAHETWCTGPAWPPKSAMKLGFSGSRMSQSLTWPSADAVARHSP